MVENPPASAGDVGPISGVEKIRWRRKWQPTPVFLPGSPHKQRSLVSCSPGVARVRYNLKTKQQSQIVSLQQENLNGASRNFAMGIFLCGT